jgi:putative transposase
MGGANQTKRPDRTAKVCHRIKRYTSDLSEQQWREIEELLPKARVGRPIQLNLREVVNGIMYVVKTGCQWANLPGEFPKVQSVYYHYRKWCLNGTWERINQALVYQARHVQVRPVHPSAAIIDSQSVTDSPQ